MRRAFLQVVLAALVCLGAAAAGETTGSDARMPGGRPTLSCWQYGIPTPTVITGDPFQVRGDDFVSNLPVQVCFSGEQCLHSEVDATGAFVQNRILRTPGTYLVTVRQARTK